MAKTQIADIIKPEPLFRDSVVERSTELSAFWQSGIVRSDPTLDAFASGKGGIFDLPFWNDLSGASEILPFNSKSIGFPFSAERLASSNRRITSPFVGSTTTLPGLGNSSYGVSSAAEAEDET